MAASNAKVAELLRRYAAALVLEGADRFKVKAFRRAAETIESLDKDVGQLVAQGADLKELPGIGKAISGIIEEIVRSGSLASLDRSLAHLKPELVELATRPALDPKKVLRVYKKLGINSLDLLRQRLDAGEIGQVLGARMEYHVRQGLDERPRILLYHAHEIAERIERYLRSIAGVTNVSQSGSLRRKKDTIGDLNFLVASKSAESVFKQFAEFGGVQSAERRGPKDMLFKLSSGLEISLSWTRADEWGFSLVLGTGSEPHLDELRAYAAKKKISLAGKSLKKTRSEVELYDQLGLEFIEPELREGRGEVEAAADGQLPQLVRYEDLRGDLHMHTTASDGANSLPEMARAAQARGYKYIAITDHSQSLKITNGLSEKRLLQQIRAIDKLNSRLTDFVVLKSAEVDILEDGRLDYSDSVLRELDFTICSIHSRFSLNKQQQTDRILRAMDNPYFNILGHATGRLLLKRQGYELDIEEVFDHAQARGCMFEINSSPDRLDLSDEHSKMAKDRGIRIAVNTDAHSVAELNFISAGINQARRAWLEPRDVVNTLPLNKLKKLFVR